MDMEDQAGAQATGTPEGRTAAFSTGLNQTGEKFNSMVPPGIRQSSVLQNPFRSGNGMASADAERLIPGMSAPMPSPNGSSDGTYQQSLYMRLRGQTIA